MDNIEILNILEYLPLEYVMMLKLFKPSIKNYLHNLFSVQYPSHDEFIISIKKRSLILDLYLKHAKNIDVCKLYFGINIACKHGDFELVRDFLERGAQFIGWGLHLAMEEGNIDIIDLIFRNGTEDYYLDYGVIAAYKNGHKRVVEYLLDLNYVTLNSCFITACLIGDVDAARFFIEKGASNLEEGLFWARDHEHEDVVRFILEYALETNTAIFIPEPNVS